MPTVNKMLLVGTLIGLIGFIGWDTGAPNLGPRAAGATVVVEGDPCVTLLAAQAIDAGTVCLDVVGEDLLVTYETTGTWGLVEAYLWVGTSLSDMPQLQPGTPLLGGASSDSYAISLACDPAYMIAHAEVCGYY